MYIYINLYYYIYYIIYIIYIIYNIYYIIYIIYYIYYIYYIIYIILYYIYIYYTYRYSSIIHVICYTMVLNAHGHAASPTKAVEGTLEYLQRLVETDISAMEAIMSRPLGSLVSSMLTGNWYDQEHLLCSAMTKKPHQARCSWN